MDEESLNQAINCLNSLDPNEEFILITKRKLVKNNLTDDEAIKMLCLAKSYIDYNKL